MGNTATKFRKALINGDETLASQLYESNPQFKESLDPNTSYGEPYQHNTPLHYAARHAMSRLLSYIQIEFLVKNDGDLFAENENKDTPCDCAEKQHHKELALSLESQMVFSRDPEADDIEAEYAALDRREPFEGLRLQDLRRLKDMLIVETADMLQAPLFTAEALLRAHDWDREKLLEAWMSNAEQCCQRSGVQMPTPPPTGYNAWDTLPSPRTPRTTRSSVTSPDEISLSPGDEDLPMCGICMCNITVFEDPVDMACGHEFCRACWEGFLNLKIQEGEAHNIFCPAYDCFQLVPVDVIESVVSREMDKRYLQFDIKAFVENNPAIRWCPTAGCERAVRLTRPGIAGSDSLSFPLLRAPAVDCGKSHLFCWECLGEAHEPCDCQTWKMWLQKVSEMKPEELVGVNEAYEDAANCLWLLTNSKPCANCKSPIQKNEGCNHMQCAKCKYDFCWICLEEWKKHSSSTGGYYRCTRYEVIQQVEEQSKEITVEAEKQHKTFQELDRFMHYYTRYKNHEHSYQLEQRLLKTAKEKMEQLSRALSGAEGGPDTTFIEDAVRELLKTRRILRCSYPYGFFLEPKSTKKEIFELMQTDLEMVTEDLAQKVNRPYLRTPRHKIIRAACLVQQKRREFLASVARGVAPNDSPEAPRRNFAGGTWDWEYLGFASPEALSSLDEDDPNIRLAIQLSLQESGLAMGREAQEFLNNEASLGAIGTSLPSRLDPAPRSMEIPRAALSSSELLELGDSLMRLGAVSNPYAGDRFDNLRRFGEDPGGLFSSSSDTDSTSYDPSVNANLLGNIMAWFHDMNPQSIALIPSMPSETDLDSQPLSTAEEVEPSKTEEAPQNQEEEHVLFKAAAVNEGNRAAQVEEGTLQETTGPEPGSEDPHCSAELSLTSTSECDPSSNPQPSSSSSTTPEWEEDRQITRTCQKEM
ncbi:Ankyrin repeat and IBR domain-containing protein 1 [Acipenser ruthenus]|uniref:RBR-type E3 ubiquitin transferase n=1 Tax=Acipenser ruthenus TaxID=7906 RepID=A0A662YTW3_ACIRT|nr:Ankyrin repeat and IBR domain-containing protein 1 [Acipenser ruthenus]